MASVVYISASTNRYHQAADTSSSSLVAFGSSKLIALWDVADKNDHGVFQTLPGHQGLVTCVRFAAEDIIFSADDQGFIHRWKRERSKWEISGVIQAHNTPISTLCVYDRYIVSGASDALVKIWEFGTAGFKTAQTISLKGRYPLALAMANLPGSTAIILAISGTSRNIELWTCSDENQFVHSASLSGHEDWIRALAFRSVNPEDTALVLASGSQDATIRLWNIEPYSKVGSTTRDYGNNTLSDELLDAFEASLGDLADADEGGRQISLKRHILTVKVEESFRKYTVTFDALLIGHEAGITGLVWRQNIDNTPTLLSTSTDSSLILWSPSTVLTSAHDSTTSLWINRQRFGDIGGQRLGGFVGGLWAEGGKGAFAWGWGGGWRRWRCDEHTDDIWHEVAAISGHHGPVKSLDWSPEGQYLISASTDQTTRIHGAVSIAGSQATPTKTKTWHEIGRPQVHGYDLIGVNFVDALKFVSIADEKVARVFEAPLNFVKIVNGLGVAQIIEGERAPSANVPPLGLSNKAVSVNATLPEINIDRRPFEGELAATTLWPEIEKVFGHGYESVSLTVSKSKQFAATACKATTAEYAVIRVYETQKWQPVGQPLEGHALTVTRITFSPDDRFVLSVSRDRSWRLFEAQEGKGFVPVAADKSHARIIWDCAWADEGDIFATASRDKTVKIWKYQAEKNKWTAINSFKTQEAATAVAFCPQDTQDRRRLAVGLESGEVLIYSGSSTSTEWELEHTLNTRIAHVDHIHQIAWRPAQDNNPSKDLAVCSEDGTLKILNVHFDGVKNHPQ